MPIYEYRCENCGEKFEKLVMGDEEITCPKCGSKKIIKLLSLFATQGLSSGPSCSSCSGGSCSSCR
ncbi:FmdB family zinc ribbon protein [Dictyoglomus turgidum]|uniref:FmdB family zinc ribbon protein n=1 Tax=Dictyoglomus turgidum TaxID=513050 RepID=UPI0023550BD9|nr:zinc ribbon domain-containing protein [Dictyoglomus turgidum]